MTVPDSPIILFGGSFDPPHRAHLELPLQVAIHVNASRLIFIPCADPPMDKGRQLSPASHRLNMLRAALDDFALRAETLKIQMDISELEIQRGGRSFTIDTLREFRQQTPDEIPLHLLIGADQAINFHLWKDHETIEAMAPPLVMCRPPQQVDDIISALPQDWPAQRLSAWRQRIVPVETLEISSTTIRLLAMESNWDALSKLVSPGVCNYLKSHQLYVPK